MEDLTGKQFGQYQIVAPLGEGGMAAVYKAYQPSMERYVALKVLPRFMSDSADFLLRFRREAKLLAQLQHPHILPVFDYGEADGYPYIVMPFVQGGTLANLIRSKQLSFSEIRRLFIQIAKALGFAHARGMIHRDMKPTNVLIDEDGNCLLSDFGLARMLESSVKLTATDAVMGTPAYMSPEQGMGNNLDQRSDLYSLGIMLYEMITGRVPYTAETPVAVVYKHIHDPLPPIQSLNPSLPEAVVALLLKALAKQPNDRFQTADDFVRAIQAAIPEGELLPGPTRADVSSRREAPFIPLQSSGSVTARYGSSPSAQRPGFMFWGLAGFGAFGVFAVLAIMGLFVFRAKFQSTPTVVATSSPIAEPTDASVIVPTDITEPEATSTTAPTLIPTTPELGADDMLSSYLSGYNIVSTETFDAATATDWEIQSGSMEDGAMVIVGNSDWNGAWLNHEFAPGEGLLIDFTFSQDSTFTIHLNNGFNTDSTPYRRFGIFFEHDLPVPDLYIGTYKYEPFTQESGFEAGRTYTLLIARQSETAFLESVWDEDEQSVAAEFTAEFDTVPENSHWTFLIQCPAGSLQLDNYAEIEFSSVK